MNPLAILTGIWLLAAAGLGAQQQVRVAAARELPAALHSGRTVLLAPGEYLVSEVAQVANPAVSWERTFDGPELVVTGVNRLTLRAPQGATLLASPRYAYTLTFRDCRDIVLEGLTLGHTEAGECDGGVLRFERCTGVRIQDCDLFGSGVLGMVLEHCTGVTVHGSTIRNCTLGALYTVGVLDLQLRKVRIADNEAWPLVSVDASRNVVLEACRIEGNVGDGLFWISPDSQAVALPGSTITANETDTLVYEGSREPDFSGTVFLENFFADQQEGAEDWEYEEGYEGDYEGDLEGE